MSRREPHTFTKPQDGSKVFWKSLADKDRPEAAQKRAETEVAASAAAADATLVRLRRGKA